MNVDTSIKSGAKNESSISVATHIYFMVAGLLSDWILSSKITLNFIGKRYRLLDKMMALNRYFEVNHWIIKS